MGMLSDAIRRIPCLLGSHDWARARQLTADSAEWRCVRAGCGSRVLSYHEPDHSPIFHGRHPYGEGATCLGALLEGKGREQGVDQTLRIPFRTPTDVERSVAAIAACFPRLAGQPRRLAQLLYLVDWRLALQEGRVATGLVWTMRAGGPDCDEAVRMLAETPLVAPRALDDAESAAVDHVCDTAARLHGLEFTRLVISTRPAIRLWQGLVADLPAEAAAQNADMRRAA